MAPGKGILGGPDGEAQLDSRVSGFRPPTWARSLSPRKGSKVNFQNRKHELNKQTRK